MNMLFDAVARWVDDGLLQLPFGKHLSLVIRLAVGLSLVALFVAYAALLVVNEFKAARESSVPVTAPLTAPLPSPGR